MRQSSITFDLILTRGYPATLAYTYSLHHRALNKGKSKAPAPSAGLFEPNQLAGVGLNQNYL